MITRSVGKERGAMSTSRVADLEYLSAGYPYPYPYPYTVADSFMNLFEGLDYVHPDFALAEALQDQESVYWSFQTYSEKQENTAVTGSSLHGYNQVNGSEHLTSTRDGIRPWENSSELNNDEALARALQETEDDTEELTSTMAAVSIEECNRGHQPDSSIPQVTWQDNLDPDNMTYEELVELGEVVGTHSRGLCPEAIASLPVSKYKSRIFSRKKNRHDRCIVCQMDYKKGEKLITLPCKHPYHQACITRWLQINKACPVCYVEVFGTSR